MLNTFLLFYFGLNQYIIMSVITASINKSFYIVANLLTLGCQLPINCGNQTLSKEVEITGIIKRVVLCGRVNLCTIK